MNWVKLEIEDKYGKRITGNEIVQLAIDYLRADYQGRKASSALVRALVNGEGLTGEGEGVGAE
jgi:hypothetical protein